MAGPRVITPQAQTIPVANMDGAPVQTPVLVIGSLAVREEDGMIIHVKTGRGIFADGGIDLAQYLNRAVRWTWLDEQPFGIAPSGRGATMAKKSIAEAMASRPA